MLTFIASAVAWLYAHSDLLLAAWVYLSVACWNLFLFARIAAKHTKNTLDDRVVGWVDRLVAALSLQLPPAPKPEDILPPVPADPNAPVEPKRPILDLLGRLLGRK